MTYKIANEKVGITEFILKKHFYFMICINNIMFLLRHVSCVPNGASVSELSILDCPFAFL
jgi:hypothetical protein